jgi:ankyrin repeat protein
MVRLLLERGADINGRRGDGMTALHAACFRGLARVAQELLDAGAGLLLAARLDVPGQAVSGPYD